ncbi:lipopolysaccharide biosynthesis protein [Haoranjiania flava]|uniref:MATE family efflux transporter n=1 Tax=Haoranjiania flava TaxID=1856322 RepID=A0AAE3INY3_9BACT|nr:MATE family efflux transporter [Haoranjiania flava]MCU7694610.1 MATE family efflux transporter [Haoranjiania flava]
MTVISSNKKIAKNTATLYIRMGITMLISFFTTRITLEVLGVEDYGLNNVVASVVTMFGFINGSMGTAVQRFFSIEIGENRGGALSRIFGTSLYLHTIVAVVSLLIAEIFAIFFLKKMNIPVERMFAAQVVFQISILSLLVNILNVPFAALLRAKEEFSKIAVLDIGQAVLKLIVLFLLYNINKDKLITLSLLNFGITLLYVLLITFLAIKLYKNISFKIVRDKDLIKKMLNFISMLIVTILASVADKQGVVIIVNLFFGLTINAAYAIAFSVSSIFELFSMNFKQSVVPQLMMAYGAGNFERMYKLLYLGTKIAFILMLIISIPAIFEMDYLLDLWLGQPPQHASTFTILLVVCANIDTFYYFIYQAVHASGKIKTQQLLVTISYFLSVLFVYLCFKYGSNFYYAVYVPIVFALLRNVLIMLSAKKAIMFNIRHFLSNIVIRSFIISVILAGVAAFIVYSIPANIYRLLLITIINCLLAVICGYYILLDKKEKLPILNIINAKILKRAG